MPTILAVSVDGSWIEAWASQKSFQRKDESEKPPPDDPGNPTMDFHGERRSSIVCVPFATVLRRLLSRQPKCAGCETGMEARHRCIYCAKRFCWQCVTPIYDGYGFSSCCQACIVTMRIEPHLLGEQVPRSATWRP